MKMPFILILMILLSSASFAMNIIRGGQGSDVLFGDLGSFSGEAIKNPETIWRELDALDNEELREIAEVLEDRIEEGEDDDDLIIGLGGDDVIFGQGGQ